MRTREHGAHAADKVTSIELFFDLVFVFAITQLSHSLIAHFTLLGLVQTGVLLAAVWWVWIFTSWTTNWFDPEKRPVRLLLIVMMFVGLLMSSAIPHAFEGSGWVFATSFVLLQVGRSCFAIWALRHEQNQALTDNFKRIVAWFLLSGAFWLGGAFAEGTTRLLLWLVALVIEYLGPSFRFWVPGWGASQVADWNITGGHIAERCSLFIIIALGESILVTGSTFSHLAWTAPTLAAFVASFIGSLAMWWIYFDSGAERGSDTIAASNDPGRLGRSVYTYLHVLLVAGIVIAAVADEIVLEHPLAGVEDHALFAIVGGCGLYILGNLLFKWVIAGRAPLSHMMGLVALAATLLFASSLNALALYSVTTAILVLVAVWESISLRSPAIKTA